MTLALCFISSDNVTNFQGFCFFASFFTTIQVVIQGPTGRWWAVVRGGALTSDWRCEVQVDVEVVRRGSGEHCALAKMSVSIWMLNLIRASGQLISSHLMASLGFWFWFCFGLWAPFPWSGVDASARQFARRLGFKSVHVQVKCQHIFKINFNQS